MDKENIKYTIERIEYLEKIFDEVKSAFESNPDSLNDDAMRKKISLLTQYMDSGQWQRDYQTDEKGELPQNLKRGILSEDGLYNLICDIEQSSRKKKNPLIKLFKKDEILFAVLWIVIYVIGFSLSDGISENIGFPKIITAVFGTILSAVIFLFIRKNELFEYFGLCRSAKSAKEFLYYIPLVFISTVNIWYGFSAGISPLTAVFSVISMCAVGFLEEIIFRGMLFNGMRKNGLAFAIIVSSLTFGIGHIVNLLSGAPVFDTMLQLVYASAAGFCYTAVFLFGKSLVPCIISHAAINSMSVFAIEPPRETLLIIAAAQTVISVAYGIWLLKKAK